MVTVKEFIIDGIVNYYAGCGAEWASDEARAIMAENEKEWEDLPCDPEGATKEQEEEQDSFLDSVATQIMDLDNPFSHTYTFTYTGDKGEDGSYREYDGVIVSAPNENIAWQIFLSTDGEFKLPDASNYLIAFVE